MQFILYTTDVFFLTDLSSNSLWPPCVADADIIFLSCGFFLLSSFLIPHLISAVADWMSTILLLFIFLEWLKLELSNFVHRLYQVLAPG